MIFLRSTLYNIFFFAFTAFACFAYLPTLLLPRKAYLFLLLFYFKTLHVAEKLLVGLDYEVRGEENLPKDSAYIVAAKHYSTYETMKLPMMLNDVSIILKRELMWIPLWGWFAAKAKMVPVDRGSRDKAFESIKRGAHQMKEQKRPILIFPQGTRVHITHTPHDKPYKQGAAHMALAANLPIIPLAHNSGAFWPRKSYIKRPGKVIFEYGPAITPKGTKKEITKSIEQAVETKSDELVQQALETQDQKMSNKAASSS